MSQSSAPTSDVVAYEAAVIRLALSTWRFTASGDEVDLSTQARVLDAVQRLVHAAEVQS